MARKIVITCALTGSFDTPRKNPAVPVTPRQIAQSALDAASAGAAVVHIHVRDPKTTKPSMDLELYRETVERIRERNTDVILNLTTGAGGRFVPGADDPRQGAEGTTLAPPAIRVRHVEALRPQICTLDVGSLNFGEQLFVNTPAHLREMADRAKAVGTKPEIEVFELGHIELAKRLIADGHIAEPPLFQLCLGIPWGAPATPGVLVQMQAQLPKNAVWSAFAISRQEFPMVSYVAGLGGNVRVGLEDNLYLGPGELAPSNAALVEKAVKLLTLLDHAVATPVEARQIFGV